MGGTGMACRGIRVDNDGLDDGDDDNDGLDGLDI